MSVPPPSPSKIPTARPTTSRTTSPSSRPPSSSRYTPPQRTPSSSSASASTSSRLSSTRDSPGDAARMPPPPRTRSLRSAASSGNVGGRRTEEERLAPAAAASRSLGKLLAGPGVAVVPGLKGSTSDPARLGRMVRARAGTVDREGRAAKGSKADEGIGRAPKGKADEGIGRAPKGKADEGIGRASKGKADEGVGRASKGKVEEGGGVLGRAMSKSGKAPETGASKTAKVESTRTRTGTVSSGKQRPVSMFGAPTSTKPDTPSAPTSGARRPSASTASMPPPAPKGHQRSRSNVTAAPPPTSANPKPKRPPFSAHNQDFTTPAPAPPSPRSRALPPPPLDTPTIHAQTQLLQLLTLHSSSAAVYQQLITSATTTLKARFEKLSARHYDVRETTLKKQKRANLDSLAAVVTNVAGRKRRESVKSPEERVQAFSEAIKRIDALRCGDFRRLCGVFGEWIAGYNPRGGGREKWVDGIGEVWRRECVSVCRKLEVSVAGVEGVAGVLSEVGEVEAVVTTVGRVVEGYKELAEGMLEEVEMMRRMEGEVVERERGELRRRVEAILEGGEEWRGRAAWEGC